jgi:hypothetical protein
MRKQFVLFATLAFGLTAVVSSAAGQTATSTALGGNRGGAFFGGFMPTNIVNTPINVSGAAMPLNVQTAVMPQQQSTKVFNVNSAFRTMHSPIFRSMAPQTPVVQPGLNNPIQPQAPLSLPPVKVQPTTSPPFFTPVSN